jgi:DNA-binding CsgD family transcriptional regulator/tetratricopeptide (TPR) repeat protein
VEKAATYSMLAGHQARFAFAYETALEHFHRALTVKEGLPNDSETAEILFGLGLAHNARGGHADEAVDALIQAFDIFEVEGETARAIAVAATGIGRSFGQAPDQVGLCERGLALTESGSIEAARVGIELGAALGAIRDFERSIEVLTEAIDIARDLENQFLEAHALVNLAFTLLGAHRLGPAIEVAEEMLDLAYRIEQPRHLRVLGHRMAAMAFVRMGEISEAKPHMAALVEIAYPDPDRAQADWDPYFASTIVLAEGRWDEAMRMADRRDSHHPTMFKFGPEVQVEFMIGDESAAVSTLVSYLERERSVTGDPRLFGIGEFALMLAVAGRATRNPEAIDLAEDAAHWLEEAPNSTPEIDNIALATRSVCAVASGDPETAAELYGKYKNNRGSISISSATRFIIPDRILALLAATMDNPEMASRHFEEAIAFSGKAGFRVEQAWAHHDYAAFQLDQGGRIDRTAILELVNKGLEITEILSMEPLQKRLADLRDSVRASGGRRAYPDGLTQREVEVLRLIATGNSNRDIADELIIIENTAAKHVANILGKTGAANRAEAATYANQQGLLKP